jgi:organic radical activating enzyme
LYLKNISKGLVPQYSDITFLDYPSPEGCAVEFFFCGCAHNCVGCHNKALQGPGEGIWFHGSDLLALIKQECNRAGTKKIVFTGGDPLYCGPVRLRAVLADLKREGYKVAVYTGYSHNSEDVKLIKDACEFVITEKYDHNKWVYPKKTETKMTFGSTNQCIIHKGELVTHGEYFFGCINKGK